MRLQFLGSGDAFGSGGRFNTCFHVTGERVNFLIDCGASSLIALKANRIERNDIRAIFITHFHGDHYGGLPFFMLDAQFFSRRTEPLTIAGPPGLRDRYEEVMETFFTGSSKTRPRFELSLVELEPGETVRIGEIDVTPFNVIHGVAGGPFFAYRFGVEGRIIAYTGDTEWTDALIEVGAGADLFIAESYFRKKRVKFHLNLASLEERLDRIQPKRLVLTHMSDDMLARLDSIEYEAAFDGKIVEF